MVRTPGWGSGTGVAPTIYQKSGGTTSRQRLPGKERNFPGSSPHIMLTEGGMGIILVAPGADQAVVKIMVFRQGQVKKLTTV